jgi:hypothetical protein
MWKWAPGAPDVNGAGTFTGTWTLQGGTSTGNQPGVYGTQGVAAAGNLPGGRWAAATAADKFGNVWLFGGQGYDQTVGNSGLLNDLWKYNIASGQWTWISGTPTADQKGTYGAAPLTAGGNPGGRQAAVLWTDTSGNVWLFGGFGLDSVGTAAGTLNDLWEFKAGVWTWISGSNLANKNGSYGKQLTAGATNVPGARWGAVGWSDASNNLWFFGGWGYDSTALNGTGYLSDIWEYQSSAGQWIWWKGSSDVNQSGAYLTNGIPFVNNLAGARRAAALWQPDANGYVTIFGGEGLDSTAGAAPGYLNDIWQYLPYP